ncbi:hypothetical protein MSG28_004761 [Choristoneura fumiferana]|uniref:Uncharacterized protein n=1 Tax=Choristoneura fumiferana TaxID=7141 RepID=A0ACC0K880_CHOFU|nr:hypothetical protein MSG28_004761 [Choristoneura fumiferana]
MTSSECYDLIRRGVDIEVPGLEVYYDKVVLELRERATATRSSSRVTRIDYCTQHQLNPVSSMAASAQHVQPQSRGSEPIWSPRRGRPHWRKYIEHHIDFKHYSPTDERESVQKKTFQKWVNSHLVRVGHRIGDLYVDMRDGKMLIKLLEVLSGERLPRPTKGKMRIHCLENVDKALQFLREQRVHLENMGSHDIVDGNPRLNLGLIWTIILRFQIQDITIEETDNKETKSAKDALLLWCQMKTAGYNNVNVRNFTTSWRDGLAFNAIIHKHRPDLIQFEKLHRSNPMHNLNNAFNVAEEKLGLTKLLDAEEITKKISKLKQETVQGKRIGKVVGIAMENDAMVQEYESLTSDLLQWIERTIEALGDRTFANSLEGVRQQLIQFANYRTVEKPPKFVEKGNLEVLLFTLQSRMRAANQKPYTPREGKMIHDINRAWERLEKSEHERELALREELIRQEKLEQLAARFNRKAQMRETWLSENQRLVSQDNFGFDLAAVEAAAKKHEAIETDIFAYHDMERVMARRDNVLRLWAYLLELLRARRARLELSLQLQQNFQEMLYILDSMEEIKLRLLTDDYGKHLMGVEDLLQKHALVVVGQSQRFLEQEEGGYRPCDPAITVERIQQLENAYAELVHLAVERRKRLEDSRKLWQFYWDMADEENWIKEKEQIVSVDDIGHDLTTVYLLISKHKALEADVAAHEPQLMSVAGVGDELVSQGHFGADRIQERLRDILSQWNHLLDVASLRKNRLDAAVRYHQLVSSEDTGVDEAQVQSLLKKHKDVTDELKNYANVIQQLKQQASELSPEDASSTEVLERLAAIDARHGELAELARLRKQRLLDALSLFKLLAEADAADQWIAEKDRMLDTMLPPKDIDDVEIMKHRYDGFDKEMNANASRVAVVNQLARQLVHVEHPQAPRIQERQARLNAAWGQLRDKAEAKKDELKSAQGVQTFHIECRETVSWIEDKKRILQQTDNLEMDLNGVMTLQRRLSGMERDLAAIQARISSLEGEANAIEEEHPEEAALIRERVLKERDSKLEEAGDLHRFLRSVDHFQAWLTKTQTDVASEDTPSSLAEAEKLLSQHQTIKEEIDNYRDEYAKMMEYGEKITAEPSTQDDPQYMFLRERLKALREGWAELQQMWENRQQLLAQSLELQLLQRDARQAEVLLTHQELRLAKTEPPTNLEQAENMIKEHEAFLTTMEANDDKINSVVQFANRLVEEKHFDADKIQRKADNIEQRRAANREKAVQQMEKLQDQLQLHQFLQDCDELGEWVQEKNVTAQDDTYRSAKTIHSKWTRHQAFEAEIAANKERLFAVQNAAEDLMKQKPEFAEVISPKMSELQDQFENLQTTTKDKGERLFDANREVLIHQTCDDIDSWMNELEKQIENTDTGTDLASVNILMQKQQMIETQMAVKAKQVTELETQAEYLQKTVPDKMDEIKEKKKLVEHRFEQLKAPLLDRQRQLAKKKEAFQFRRDVEDENLWVHEKMPLATSTDYGNSLFNVQMLQKKNQSLKTETDNHEPHAIEQRKNNLAQWEKAQQYLFDANEAEAWMSEQELYMMVEDRGKDEISAQNLMKKHEILEQAVDDYAQTIRQLGETVRQLTSEEHPLSEQISVKQSQVDKLYAGLKDLAGERRAKLDEALRLFQLSREVDDLEQWITERELVASSQELGQDYDHVTLLWERFKEFARETQAVGSERVATAERIADQMIGMGHSDNATIAQWKEGLKETWQDLLELIETRTQREGARRQRRARPRRAQRRRAATQAPHLHAGPHHAAAPVRASETARGVSDELGRDALSVGALQRKQLLHTRDVSGVELLMNNHQSLKAEIDTREDNFSACISLGKELLSRQHYAATDIKEKLLQLTNQRNALLRRWEERWENLQLSESSELGHTIDEVESLIKKHEAFEKSAAAQEDRFSALQRLTTLELREATLWPSVQPWDKYDESTFTFQPPPPMKRNSLPSVYNYPNEPPVGAVVKEIIHKSGKYKMTEQIQPRQLTLDFSKQFAPNDSYLWTKVGNNSLSTISEFSSPPISPLKRNTLTPDIYSSVFFEYPAESENNPCSISLSCIDFILWERLSSLHIFPNVSLLRHASSSSSKSGSIKRFFRKWSRKSKTPEPDSVSDVAVLSLPGLTSSNKAVNDLGKDVKTIPLNSSLILLAQTRTLLYPEAEWYYTYLDSFEVKEMKRRQEAAEAAEREKREREAAEAAAAAAAKDQHVVSHAEASPRPATPPAAPVPAPALTPTPPPASAAVERPGPSKQTPAKPARLSTAGSSSSPATPSSSGKVKSRSRSKSPFRSFRWKTAKKLLAGAHHSDDEEGASPASEDEGVEGTLVRKHEWESAAKRASNRSWDKVYVVAKDGRMSFYKDQKAYKSAPDQCWRGEAPLDLNGAVVEVAANYTKKKHVFRLRLAMGAEFLLQAHDDSEMSWWLEALRARTAAPASRSHTLPAPSKDEPKRRSFFTLKKKSCFTNFLHIEPLPPRSIPICRKLLDESKRRSFTLKKKFFGDNGGPITIWDNSTEELPRFWAEPISRSYHEEVGMVEAEKIRSAEQLMEENRTQDRIVASIAPIALPEGIELFMTFDGETGVAAGYGRTSDLSHVALRIVSTFYCRSVFGFTVTEWNMCTDGLGGVGDMTVPNLPNIFLIGFALLALTAAYEDVVVEYHDSIVIPNAARIKAEKERIFAQQGEVQHSDGRIVGGAVSAVGAHPYLVKSLVTCCSSLLSQNSLVTAAHCWLDTRQQAWQFTVVLGSNWLYTGGTRIATSNVVMSQCNPFTPPSLANDVAMIYLLTNVWYSDTIQPIALPSTSQLWETFAGEWAIAAGYGKTSEAQTGISTNSITSHVNIQVISVAQCQAVFGNWALASNICTNDAGVVGICSGDSGGPLHINHWGQNILGGLLINLLSGGLSACGSSLISQNRAVTAAHCWFDGWNQAWQFTIALGTNMLFYGGTRIATSQVVLHPQWNTATLANDVAVIYLPQNVWYSNTIQPIALPSSSQLWETFVGEWAVAAGYGKTNDAQTGVSTNSVISHVNIQVISVAQCQAVFGSWALASNICTNGAGGVGICSGDSGGPLYINRWGQNILVGISSFVAAAGCQLGHPSAFARVTSFHSFITQNM